mmetsp:Transcript_60427/g.129575  ORF Transcript_60427/g.129575 Transcript_60427/m.129575 type:complete len:543 (+) Transcript_60427:40-1668(+)
MDFDDLEDAEEEAGPGLMDQREDFIAKSKAPEPEKEFPFPKGSCFGANGKLKCVYLHGGGTNARIGGMQINNVTKEVTDSKTTMEWSCWTGTHSVPLGWNGDFSLKPFGPEYSVYFERWPYANCQRESWDGIEKTFDDFAAYLKETGPLDGVMGFDMGGEFLVHVARKAQEGDPRFQGCFRFMILFTSGSSKLLSSMGSERPKFQLKIPVFLSWCNGDMNHSFCWYEETCLFFHPSHREVCCHLDGHMPPRFQKGSQELNRFNRFINSVRKTPRTWEPSDHHDNKWCANIWLPMTRSVPAPAPAGAPRRLLIIGDPMGAHNFRDRIKENEALIAKGVPLAQEGVKWVVGGSAPDPVGALKLKLKVSQLKAEDFEKEASGIKVDGFEYSKEQKQYDWHCAPDAVPSRMLFPEDIIEDEKHVTTAKLMVESLMGKIGFEEDDQIHIVGLATGSWLALAVAKLLFDERRQKPAALWLVNAPTRLPWSVTEKPCGVLDTPIHYLTNETSTVGPPWRYEVMTSGPFEQLTYASAEDLVSLIVKGAKA